MGQGCGRCHASMNTWELTSAGSAWNSECQLIPYSAPELALPCCSLEQLCSLELGGEHAGARQDFQRNVVDAHIGAVPLHLHLVQRLRSRMKAAFSVQPLRTPLRSVSMGLSTAFLHIFSTCGTAHVNKEPYMQVW